MLLVMTNCAILRMKRDAPVEGDKKYWDMERLSVVHFLEYRNVIVTRIFDYNYF